MEEIMESFFSNIDKISRVGTGSGNLIRRLFNRTSYIIVGVIVFLFFGVWAYLHGLFSGLKGR